MPHGGADVDLGHDLLALFAHGVRGVAVHGGVVVEGHLLEDALLVVPPAVQQQGLLDEGATVHGQHEQSDKIKRERNET